MKKFYISSIVLLVIFCCNMAVGAESFEFESITSLDEMSSLIRSKFSLGTSRTDIRRTFVDEGKATLKIKTGSSSIEKYIYDIDLCHYYVWRWNISMDYDSNNKLRQAYVNGNTIFPDGIPKKVISKIAEDGKQASIYQVQRPRPEAYKGEQSLGFLLFDRDSDPDTTDDQAIIGAGPSRAEPMNMGKLVTYTDVNPWRSIFDFDATDRIVPYRGDCKEVDSHMETQRR